MRFLLNLVLLCAPPLAAGQDICSVAWKTEWEAKCGGIGAFQAMSRCFAEKVAETEKELNQLYTELRTDLVDPKPLINAERAWIRFRAAECSYAASGYDCSSGISGMCNLSQGLCIVELSCDRINQLREHLNKKCNGCPERKSD